MSDRTLVQLKVVSNLPKATMVTIEPDTEDDWEVLELNAEHAEQAILKQVLKIIICVIEREFVVLLI